jgi:threonine 3-dehydrogenase
VITDVNDYRLDLARKMAPTRVVNPRREKLPDVMKELGMTEGFDVGMEMSGNAQAFQDLIAVMNNGGRVAVLGIFPQPVAIDWGLVCFHGLFLKGIYGREMFETWYKMTSMLQSGLDISPVITHRFPIDEFERGFQVMRNGEAGKVVLEW